jgi:hypothetical protein
MSSRPTERPAFIDRFLLSTSRYAFNVAVSCIITPIERNQLRAIVGYLKPAHTHFVDMVELFPRSAKTTGRWA